MAHIAVRKQDEKYLETLASSPSFNSWNSPDYEGDTPICWALKHGGKTEIVEILAKCPRVDLSVVDVSGNHLEDVARYLVQIY